LIGGARWGMPIVLDKRCAGRIGGAGGGGWGRGIDFWKIKCCKPVWVQYLGAILPRPAKGRLHFWHGSCV
jgi:hypothetical protein